MAAPRVPLPILLSEPDASLARRVNGGDDAAFEVLVGRHGDALGRFCRALLRNPEDAEDALQATFLRAYRALGRADRPTAVRAWLLRIARNECLRVAGARSGTEPLSAEPPVEARLSERVEARDDLRVLGRDLRALPERQRAAIVLREICGLSHRQAADVIGVTPEAVRRLVHDARLTLERFGAGRELDCAEVRRRIAGGDGRVLRARAVGAPLRACADCREVRARARRPLAALLPPLPGIFAGRWLGAKVAAGTLASAVVVSGVLVVTGIDPPARGQADAAPARAAAAAASSAAAPREVAARSAAPAARPATPRPADASAASGPDTATPAPAPAGESAPAPPSPVPAGSAPATPAPSGSPAPPAATQAPTASPAGPGASAQAPAAPAVAATVTTTPAVTATVATAPATAAVSAGAGGVSAGAQVTVPALQPVPALPSVPPVTASAEVSVDPTPEPGAAPVQAPVDPGLGLPVLRVALP